MIGKASFAKNTVISHAQPLQKSSLAIHFLNWFFSTFTK